MTLQSLLLALQLLHAPSDTAPGVAGAVLRHAKSPMEAAFILAWGRAESGFDSRIIRNECKRWECDHGLAVGGWQMHRRAAGPDWDELPGNIDAQVRSAARMTRWALKQCGNQPRCAFRVLGGLRPETPLKGENARVSDFERVRRAL